MRSSAATQRSVSRWVSFATVVSSSSHGHGLADIASSTPVTADTVFRIGSITKTFTAMAVMQLWERGLIDLDAPANDYLRAYRLDSTDATFRPATVRHLLTHTSGIPDVLRVVDLLPSLVGPVRWPTTCSQRRDRRADSVAC